MATVSTLVAVVVAEAACWVASTETDLTAREVSSSRTCSWRERGRERGVDGGKER